MKVICIDNVKWQSDIDFTDCDGPKKDEILNIDGFDENGHLLFFKYCKVEGYYKEHFRPIDMDFVEEVIKQVTPKEVEV